MRFQLLTLALAAFFVGASMAADAAGDHSLVTLPRILKVESLGSPLQIVPVSPNNARPATSIAADYTYLGMKDSSRFTVEVRPVGPLTASQAVTAVEASAKDYEDSVRGMIEKGATLRAASRFKPDLPLLKPPVGEPVSPEAVGTAVYLEQKGVATTSVIVFFYRNMHIVRVATLIPETSKSPTSVLAIGNQFAKALSEQMDLRNFGSCSRAGSGDPLQRWRNRCAASKEELQATKQGPEFTLKRG